jgi:hypothetical protein
MPIAVSSGIPIAGFQEGSVSALMEIRFISSLAAEDENVFAPALLKAIGALLDQFPIVYTMRIETTGAQVFQHSRTAPHVKVEAPQRAAAGSEDQEMRVAGALAPGIRVR